MMVRVELFAVARERAGSHWVTVDLGEEATVADLKSKLATAHPAIAEILPRVAVAVNADYASDSRKLSSSDEVAIIPPVSGG